MAKLVIVTFGEPDDWCPHCGDPVCGNLAREMLSKIAEEEAAKGTDIEHVTLPATALIPILCDVFRVN